tara:strand:+ start:102 stop:740 length:639 start_codon:yes stop_codon:yes gene_type:complete
MANLKIFGTPTSPPTRIARVAGIEFGHIVELCELAWRVSPDELFDLNPAGRVPVLVHEDVTLWDSRQIWSYIERLDDSNPHESVRNIEGAHRWREANMVTLGYELMGAMMILRGMEEQPSISDHPYLHRNIERRDRCLKTLDDMSSSGWLVEPTTFGLADALMICATDALVGREVIDIKQYPSLSGIRMRYSTRKSLVETLGEYYPGQRGGL